MNTEPEPLSQSPEPDPVPILQPATFEWPPGVDGVVARHWEKLYERAYAKVNDEDGATDIVQNTIIRHLRNPGRYPEEALYKPLLGWETSRWFARQKKHRALAGGPALEALEHAFKEGPDALDGVINGDTRRRIMHALDQLSATDREVMIRFYFQDEPTRDIAAALGIEDTAVRVRLNRARKRLRAVLEKN